MVVVEEAPSHTHPPPPHPPPIATAAATSRSILHHRGALPPIASAASPPTILALCPRMLTSTPSLPRRCPRTSRVRYRSHLLQLVFVDLCAEDWGTVAHQCKRRHNLFLNVFFFYSKQIQKCNKQCKQQLNQFQV